VSYQAPSGALSLNFNTIEVRVFRVAGSKVPGVSVVPSSPHVVVDSRARLGKGSLEVATREIVVGAGRSADDREVRRTEVRVRGRLSGPTASARRRVADPALFCGGAFALALAELSGTEPLPVEVGVAPSLTDAHLVAFHRSPPLIEVVDGTLAFSNNFMAEQLLRTLGWRLTKDPGDWDNGSAVLRGYWSALGNDPADLVFENGSGMSEVGRVSTASLVDLLVVAHRSQRGLLDALPVAGQEGTVGARLRTSGKRVRAKTGTLDGVSGLTGVITREDGTPQVAFSILINVRDAQLMAASRRAVEDAIVMTLLDHLDAWATRQALAASAPASAPVP
jgi:D-alanyl-D-alanine carboxypeptidase/D-alanyl-D-alanine-endopeptidase (penicillin-binding protein 4)